MYTSRAGLILAFHGCDASIVEKVVLGKEELKASENVYDWLGHGIYFWDSSPSRALEFANQLKIKHAKSSKNKIENPAVIGAVLNLGFCLDLLDYENLQVLKSGYDLLDSTLKSAKLPENKKVDTSHDLLLRDLDCAVIETLHQVRSDNKLQPYDSVRGVFWEGEELYPNAGFREKDHIQICIRNPNCVKGYFIPKDINKLYKSV